jgi:hypothetical protein
LKQGGLIRILLGLRNNRVAFTVAQRHLRELDPDLRHAILSNARTITSFRVGAKDGSRSNNSPDLADIARLANYPVKTIDRMNVEAS